MHRDTKFLKCRDGHWYYERRVPARYAAFDDRKRRRKTSERSFVVIGRDL
ncbi:MAG: hypothetical protein AAGF15_05510 [Pseudomonadota bacterium]